MCCLGDDEFLVVMLNCRCIFLEIWLFVFYYVLNGKILIDVKLIVGLSVIFSYLVVESGLVSFMYFYFKLDSVLSIVK